MGNHRDVRLDTLRGFMLVLITINHFGSWSPDSWWITQVTWQPFGYVSAAEGFVFLSGFIFSVVYMRYCENPDVLWRRAARRAFEIYLHHLALVLGLAVCFLFFPFYRSVWTGWFSPYHLTPFTSTLASVLLLHQPPYLDILPIYVLFVFFSPIVLLLFSPRQHGIVLASSFFLWLLGQQVDLGAMLTHTLFPGHRSGYFNFLSWQFLYVLGLWGGDRYRRNEPLRILSRKPVLALIFVVTFLLFLSRHLLVLPEITFQINRSRLELLRLVNFLLLAAGIGGIFPKISSHLHVPWLAFLGQHSLQVFSFQAVLLYLLAPATARIAMAENTLWFPSFIVMITLCLSIPAFLHHQYRIRALAAVAPQ